MPDLFRSPRRLQLFAIGAAAIAISALFIGMIWNYLTALLLAAIFSAMSAPIYQWAFRLTGERSAIAVAITLILLAVCVLLPTLMVTYLVAVQASELTDRVSELIRLANDGQLEFTVPDWVPFREMLVQVWPTLFSKLSEITGSLASMFASMASQLTRSTAQFFVGLFIMIYAMVFFLPERSTILAQLMVYSGLSAENQQRIVERILSISRATIKGTFIIGICQGSLGGLGFYFTGISGAAFWGAVMAVASIIPGIGPSLIMIPGIIYLFAIGETTSAIGLAIWAALVVSSIDNVLRPYLVGKDTKMPDLLILLSTLGGLAMFGAVGLILGPVIAGVFLTIWEILGEELGGDAESQLSVEPSSDNNGQ